MKAVVALALAVPLLLTGCGLLSAEEELLIPVQAGALTSDPGIGLTVIPESERGEPLDLAGVDLQGEPLALSDSRGDITVVNSWATWCAPCRTEMPEFAEAAQAFEGQGVTFVGINVEDNEDDARASVDLLPQHRGQRRNPPRADPRHSTPLPTGDGDSRPRRSRRGSDRRTHRARDPLDTIASVIASEA